MDATQTFVEFEHGLTIDSLPQSAMRLCLRR
jgi:hypothetical protein